MSLLSPSLVPSPLQLHTLPTTQIPDGILLFDRNSPNETEDADSECEGTRPMQYFQLLQAACSVGTRLTERLCVHSGGWKMSPSLSEATKSQVSVTPVFEIKES